MNYYQASPPSSDVAFQDAKTDKEDFPTILLDNDIWLEDPVPDRHLCIHEPSQFHCQCSYPWPYSLDLLPSTPEDTPTLYYKMNGPQWHLRIPRYNDECQWWRYSQHRRCFRLWIWTVVWINFDTPQILYTCTRMSAFMNTDNLYNYGYLWTIKCIINLEPLYLWNTKWAQNIYICEKLHELETFINSEHMRMLCTCFSGHLCMIYAHDLEHYIKEYLRAFTNG